MSDCAMALWEAAGEVCGLPEKQTCKEIIGFRSLSVVVSGEVCFLGRAVAVCVFLMNCQTGLVGPNVWPTGAAAKRKAGLMLKLENSSEC